MIGNKRSSRSIGLGRSWNLFAAFRVEQPDPGRFYGLLADDSAALIAAHCNIHGSTLLDVGAGPAEFAKRFRGAGARYIALDYDQGVDSVADGGIVGDAQRMPIKSGAVDIAFSSNLIEHVPRAVDVANEMVRVTKPGGLIVIAYTNWLSPWGGHETSPYHWISGKYAVDRYRRRNGVLPKNQLNVNVFKVSVAWGIDWASHNPNVKIVEARPRYLPLWCRFIVRVPVFREFLSWNLLLILRRK